jgi:two-component system response regulator TtrR
MTENALTLYVVDDDEALRRSLLLLLFSQGLAVQGFDSGEAFLKNVNPQRLGCAILDLRMNGMNGLAVLEELRRQHSPLVVLFLSGHGDIPTALEAVRLGAFDWVVKPNTQQLLDKLPAAMAEARERASALDIWMELTPREREVARHVALGQSNKDIAQQLNPPCSPRSVESHRARLFDKLALPNDNELSRWLSRHAWLE